jgi:hypothetical protein
MGMNLDNFLSHQRNTIIKKWFDCVVGTYAPETSGLLKKESNQFANPVGHTILHGIEAIFDEFLRGMDREKLTPHLDRIIRIRAVQDFSPAQAISFIFSLKQIVRDELKNHVPENPIPSSEIAAFESKVDQLGLLAFNIYTQCRERLYEVRLNEFKMRTFRLLQRANLLAEIPEWETKSKGINQGINHQQT